MSPTRRERAAIQREEALVNAANKVVKDFSPLRRRLIVGGFAFTAASLLGAPFVINYLSQASDETSPQLTLEHLKELDRTISGKPQELDELAPEIGEMAITYFCKEMDYKREDFPGTYSYEWEEQYIKKLDDLKTCTNSSISIYPLAYTNGKTNDSHFKLDGFLFSGLEVSKTPATKLFIVALHESHHNKAPLIALDPPQEVIDDSTHRKLIISERRGFEVMSPSPQYNLPGKECLYKAFVPLEEGAVDDSTRTMIKKVRVWMEKSIR